ncbi:GIY-YIG nuclease family protein [Sphingomonas sp. ABOLE]|uniref:GIY-YIG nuclease family protein n=1 Tax=Sphingomonas sp. ABOLE TaxID=1985878 RepID=UPI001F49F106|nr:GIY-YIG nuclease family protein [Sphingomonas sp. ABOLE]
MDKVPCVYMLASGRHGTLYTGLTSDLMGRIHQHRSGTVPGFTKRNNVKRLVWYEVGGDMAAAIKREKQLKEWKRDWKIVLIEKENPFWEDLAISLGFPPLDAPAP